MNNAEEDLVEDLMKEYMEAVAQGDRKAWDYATEHSSKVNITMQAHCADLMRATGSSFENRPEGQRATELALWTLCERRSLLDCIEAAVAQKWAEQELPKRIDLFQQMRDEQDAVVEYV